MVEYDRRKNDTLTVDINKKLDKVLEILNPSKGDIGVIAQVQVNKTDIKKINKRPSALKNILVAIAIVTNTVLAAMALRG